MSVKSQIGGNDFDPAPLSVGDQGLGDVYQASGDLAEAESSLLVHLELYAFLGSKKGMAAAYGNLGIVYETLGDLEPAEAMYKQSIALFQQDSATAQAQQVQALLDKLPPARAT